MIPVLWKPKAFVPAPFKVRSRCLCFLTDGISMIGKKNKISLAPHILLYDNLCNIVFNTCRSDLMFLQTSQISARTVEVTGGEEKTVPNVEGILEDFRIMGKGLVKSVEARTEKWSF